MSNDPTPRFVPRRLRVFGVIVAVLALPVAACSSDARSPSSDESTDPRVEISDPPLDATPSFDEPEQPMPESGIPRRNILVGGWDHPGQLVITVQGGTDTYLVELRYPESFAVVRVFVSPGQTISVDVPVDGTSAIYQLFYAAGSRWYGDQYSFGPEGTYAMGDEVFEFAEGTQWQLELIPQTGGNLGTSAIDYTDF